jgi:hypothetical protein
MHHLSKLSRSVISFVSIYNLMIISIIAELLKINCICHVRENYEILLNVIVHAFGCC